MPPPTLSSQPLPPQRSSPQPLSPPTLSPDRFPGRNLVSSAVTVRRGERLAHWELAASIYHIVFRLADSVPSEQLQRWQEARRRYAEIVARENRVLTESERREYGSLYAESVEKYLAAGHGRCILRIPAVAEVVRRTLLHDHGVRYDLHAWTIMPNHVHVVVGTRDGTSIKKVVEQWKHVSGHAITGQVEGHIHPPIWMRDNYSHIIRTADEYVNQVRYVWRNPEAAGLKEGFLRERY